MNLNHCFSSTWCSLPDNIKRFRTIGNTSEAVRLIDLKLADDKLPTEMRKSMTAYREMILRLPGQFPYSDEDALNKIREYIPEFTKEEFCAYIDSGKARWIFVNGERRFYERFFQTLCKTDPAFALRAGVTLPGVESAVTDPEKSRLNISMKKMKETGSTKHRITIKASVAIKDEYFTPGMKVRAWLPVPEPCGFQKDISIKANPEGAYISAEDAPQRTVCWCEEMTTNHPFTVEYSYTSELKYNDIESIGECRFPEKTFDTEELAPHITFSPYIKALAAELAGDEKDPLKIAKAFYDYITLNMSYTFMPDYFCLETIAETGARNMTGDCGVFALIFIALCRAAGIPAVWQSGLIAEPGFMSGHDWARFYVEPAGWLYADPSFGTAAKRVKNEERRQYYFGNIDGYRMVANRAFQADFDPPSEGWRCDPYDNQLGEMECDGRGLKYSEFLRSKEIVSFEELI